jgi:hypothetical protein
VGLVVSETNGHVKAAEAYMVLAQRLGITIPLAQRMVNQTVLLDRKKWKGQSVSRKAVVHAILTYDLPYEAIDPDVLWHTVGVQVERGD